MIVLFFAFEFVFVLFSTGREREREQDEALKGVSQDVKCLMKDK